MIVEAPLVNGPYPANPLKTAYMDKLSLDVVAAAMPVSTDQGTLAIELRDSPASSTMGKASTYSSSPTMVAEDDEDHIATKDDRKTFWKHADNHLIRVAAHWLPFVPVRANGTLLYDADGRKMLDFTSGQMSSILGHNHPEIMQVIHDTAPRLDHLFSSMLSQPNIDLAVNLTQLLPPQLSKCLFLSTGSESVESAIKMAKIYTGKWEIVSMSTGYHGMSGGSASATFVTGRVGTGPLIPGNYCLPVPEALYSPFRRADGSHDWETELNYGFNMIDRQSTGSLAACIIEPIISTGGMIELPHGYLKALKRHCEKRGMLLIMDEAQTAMGRTGHMFAFEHGEIVPDILCISKTLGAGLPLAATVTSHEIESVCHARGFMYYTTHMNDPLTCAVGAKVCQIAARDDFSSIAREKGAILKTGLQQLKEEFPVISEVRGRGLMLGLHLQSPDAGFALSEKALELGLNCNLVPLKELGGTIRIVPPINISMAEIKEGLDILRQSLEIVQARYGSKV